VIRVNQWAETLQTLNKVRKKSKLDFNSGNSQIGLKRKWGWQ